MRIGRNIVFKLGFSNNATGVIVPWEAQDELHSFNILLASSSATMLLKMKELFDL
jgi:hypothetical protein